MNARFGSGAQRAERLFVRFHCVQTLLDHLLGTEPLLVGDLILAEVLIQWYPGCFHIRQLPRSAMPVVVDASTAARNSLELETQPNSFSINSSEAS